MKKRQFKTESKKVLDIMINSIYTNKEIFLRELISNASDALDKLHYLSLTDKSIKVNNDDLYIKIDVDDKARTLTITDNGIGMTEEELENNLGTIAESGSLHFKEENSCQNDANIIGQFGVGFYSAFMVSDKVTVESKSYKEDKSYIWESNGIDGYTLSQSDKKDNGTKITLHIKEDTEDYKYSDFLTEYKIREIIKKYSDYINYPIKMEVSNTRKKEDSDEYETYKELTTLNSMIPLWKKNKEEIKNEEYNNFYSDKFYDYNEPLKTIHFKVEGNVTYTALLFIPSHASYDYYSKEYTKGLQLYTNGVLIMDKCSDLLPDYYSFVRGVVDTEDIPLNISRETLQEDKNIKLIAKSIESKIKKELLSMLKEDRENYEKYWDDISPFIKFGCLKDDKFCDKMKDYILFKNLEGKYLTLPECLEENKEKHENKVFYVTDEIKQGQYIKMFKDAGIDAVILKHSIDQPFITHLEQKNENVKFLSIDSDLSETFKEETSEEDLSKAGEKLAEVFKKALNNDKLTVKAEKLVDKNISSMITVNEESKRMADMMKMYASSGMDMSMFGETGETLVLNLNNELVKYVLDNPQSDNVTMICEQLYDLAKLSHEPLKPEQMTAFIARSNEILKLLAK